MDLDVNLHAAPHVVRRDEVEFFRPALSDDDLPERAHGVVARLVLRLDGDARNGPVSLDSRAVFRLERRLERPPQELDVRVHLIIRNLKGARFLRRDNRLADLAGDFLGRADGSVRDLPEDHHPLPVPFALNRGPRPGQVIRLPFSDEEAALHEGRDLADRAVLERAE